MKGSAVKKTSTWVICPLILTTLLSFFTLISCAEIKLGTIPTPPPKAKLRIFVNPISDQRSSRKNWATPHHKFKKEAYERVRRVLGERAIYDVVSEEEVRIVMGSKEPMGWQWEKNNWALAIEAGKRLHSEYALIIRRGSDSTEYFQFVLINLVTEKIFKESTDMTGESHEVWLLTYKSSLNKIFHDANEDLLATASRKGQIASKELAQTKKEIQELIESQKDENKKLFDTKKENALAHEMIKAPEKSKEKEDNLIVKVPQKKESSASEISKQEKVAQLEARLAKLMETLAQVEIVKKQFEEQRKKSALLSKELAEREQREKMLLSKLEDSSKAPPVIVLASPGDNSKTEVSFIYISGVVEDEKGIKRLEIFLNDKLLKTGSERGLEVTQVKSPKRLEFKERVPLEKGVNQVKVRAVDSDGLFTDKTLTVHYVKKRKDMWAVIIGIDKYPNVRQLKYAVNDARIFYDHLVKYNQIPAENVILLLDQDATLTKIRSALGTGLKNKAGKDDMVLIYFAGHGATERDTQSPDGDGLEKYLLPVDADLKDLYSTALPMGELSRIFNRIRSERLIYIADACYSGASGGRTIGVSGTRASISDAFMDRISGGKGRVIITASGANEVSTENDELEHGVFTYFLIEGLKGPADMDKDGIVTVDEAYDYVSRHVPQATSQEQHPVKKGTVEGRLILSFTQIAEDS